LATCCFGLLKNKELLCGSSQYNYHKYRDQAQNNKTEHGIKIAAGKRAKALVHTPPSR